MTADWLAVNPLAAKLGANVITHGKPVESANLVEQNPNLCLLGWSRVRKASVDL
jgi:hypothetical protein